MCDEDGHAIGHGHGHRRSTARAQMAVRLRSPQKALPLSVVMEDSVAMYLIRGDETGLSPADEDAQRRPTGGDVAHRLVGVHAEAAGGAAGGEGRHTELGERLDDLTAG